MKRKSLVVAVLTLMSLLFVGLGFIPEARASILYVGGGGPGNYTMIQAAIDDANPGDTIFVFNGTYDERLVISRSISLVGEGRNTTTIEAGGAGTPIYISTSHVNVTGFSLTGGESDSWEAGIVLDGSRNCHVHNNTISLNNGYGVALYFSTGNVVEGNNISSNGWEGVKLYESSNNIIAANFMLSNGWEGVLALWSPNNTIANNIIQNNTAGVHVNESPNNTVAYNYLSDNDYGIYVDTSSGNTIYHNNFVDNGEHACDNTSGNQWDDGYPSGGNYWSGYWVSDVFSGPNQAQPGGDGLGDVSYGISRGPASDRYPLIDPQETEPLPPSAPRSLQATARNQQVVLAWNPPTFDGNSPVMGYTVYRGPSPVALTSIAGVGAKSFFVDTGLINGQTYYYAVSAWNAAGEEGPMSESVGAIPMNELPSCTISTPDSGETISGLFSVAGTANDTDGTVIEVEIRVDDGPWIEVNGTTSWSYDWDTTVVDHGNHTIYARSYDGEDYSETAQVSVWVDQGYVDDVVGILGLPGWLWIVIVSVVIVVMTAVLLLLLARKRKRGQSGDQTPET